MTTRRPYVLAAAVVFGAATAGAQARRRTVTAPRAARRHARCLGRARESTTWFAWVDASGRDRGAVQLSRVPDDTLTTFAALRSERTFAPSATRVALAFGTDGRAAIAWIAPHPERRDTVLNARAHNHGVGPDPFADPLGPAARSSGDVWFQALDHDGRPAGPATLVFSEHARALHVAIDASGDGWRVAWTGARVVDGEVRGAVRTARIDATGDVPDIASDLDFTGQNGDVLALAADTVVFSGEACAAHDEETVAIAAAPHELAPPRGAPPQGTPHEHAGPAIACGPVSLFAVDVRDDGVAGPTRTLATLAIDSALIDAHGFTASTTRENVAVLVHGTLDGGATELLASPSPPVATAMATATAGRVFAGGSDVLFVRAGVDVTAPLVRLDPASAVTTTPAWSGDERFLQHLLHARAARAGWNDVATTLGPQTDRPGAVSTPRLLALADSLERARGRWSFVCDQLTVRARWLARHGAPRAVEDFARGACDIPAPIVLPPIGAPVAPLFPGP